MFATGFSMNAESIAEPYEGDTEKFLSETAKRFHIFIVAGAAMRRRDGRPRNKALIFSPTGELLAFYAKMRPFTPGGEAQHYAGGHRPVCFRWLDCSVSTFICYDLRFPELFREAAAQAMPELFVVIANFPEKRIHHWVRLLQARAIENQAYVAGVNRIGRDPFVSYPGRSVLIDPQGDILADGGNDEAIIRTRLDLQSLRKYRKDMPFLADMRATP
jgi:predicted amidohydrolase